jgi:hypothetical protein
MSPFTRSLAERLIDALELYVNGSGPQGERPREALEPAATPLPRALAWLAADARRILRRSAVTDEVGDRKAAS